MLSQLALIFSVLSLTAGAPVNSTGVVHLPLHKEYTKVFNGTRIHKRNPDQHLTYSGYRYWADFTAGGQPLTCLLDTGSSDTFTFTNEAFEGGWVPGQSSDYKWQNDDFRAAFGDGSNRITGSWATDSIEVGGATIKDYPIGLLNSTYEDFPDNKGILAIGPQSAETPSSKYPTIFQRMKDAGQIGANVFSLYSDNGASTDAHLLFGGIDVAKFDGKLQTVPFAQNEIWGNTYYSVDWQFQGQWYEGGILDTGTPNILLPQDIVDSEAQKYNCVQSEDGTYIANGTPSQDIDPIVITVGGVDIKVEPFSEVQQGVYSFALQYAGSPEDGSVLYTLGDPFLRAVYSVFDIDNQTYGFAQMKVSQESNIMPIGDSIPNSTPAPDQSTDHTGNGNPGTTGDDGFGDDGESDGDGDGDGDGGIGCVIA